MATLDKVKILVVGDSGVGKSSLVHLVCHNEPPCNPSWTIGCAVNVKLQEYKEGTPEQRTFFVELWDIGGSSSHANSRSVFYAPVHGVILVHDLTNKKSEQNLRKWLAEVLNRDGNGKTKASGFEYDPEQFVDSLVPIMVLGTKLDLAQEVRSSRAAHKSPLAEECRADEMLLDCLQVKSIAPGSSNAVKLSRFFDKAIERRYFGRETNQSFMDRQRHMPPQMASSSKAFHAD